MSYNQTHMLSSYLSEPCKNIKLKAMKKIVARITYTDTDGDIAGGDAVSWLHTWKMALHFMRTLLATQMNMTKNMAYYKIEQSELHENVQKMMKSCAIL